MGAFLDWFFAFLTTMIDGIWKIISGIFGGIFQIFNIITRFKSEVTVVVNLFKCFYDWHKVDIH